MNARRSRWIQTAGALGLLVAQACTPESAAERFHVADDAAIAIDSIDPIGASTQAVATCGGNYGAAMAAYGGVTFFSNGACTGTASGAFQCVEGAERFAGHPEWVGNGNSFCDPAKARASNLVFVPNGSPGLDGDIVGFNGASCGAGYGHVGVRCGTTATGWILCDQNRTSIVGNVPKELTRSGNVLGSFASSCTLCGYMRPGVDFDSTGLGTGSYGWTVTNARLVRADATGITLDPGDTDPQLRSPANLYLNPNAAAAGYSKIRVRIRSRAADTTLRVYFTTSNYPTWSEAQAESATIPITGAFTEVVVNLSVNGYWTYGGRVNQVRVDPVRGGVPGSTADTIDIDWIKFER